MVEAGRQADALRPVEGLAHVLEVVASLAPLSDKDRALLGFAVRLTLRPRGMLASHLGALLRAGWTEPEAHDITQVVACFSYMNRLADGLGVALLPEALAPGRATLARQIHGEEALMEHRRWGQRPQSPSCGA